MVSQPFGLTSASWLKNDTNGFLHSTQRGEVASGEGSLLPTYLLDLVLSRLMALFACVIFNRAGL
jgi:hypothetical protein